MNAGMFGLPNGQGGNSRKLAGRVGIQSGGASSTLSAASAFKALAGIATTSLAVSAGVRTRIVAVNGRGAVRALAVEAAFASPPPGTLRVELFIDGVLFSDTGAQSLPPGNGGLVCVGTAGETSSVRQASLDYLPFESSVEVWITRSVAETIVYASLLDLHQ